MIIIKNDVPTTSSQKLTGYLFIYQLITVRIKKKITLPQDSNDTDQGTSGSEQVKLDLNNKELEEHNQQLRQQSGHKGANVVCANS